MSPTDLLGHIKTFMGHITRVIPITDDEIMEIVFQETLPVYSSYFPYFKYITVNVDRDQTERPGVYRIVHEPEMRLLGVTEILRDPIYSSGAPYYMPYFNTTNVFEAQAAADLNSMTTVPTTFRFFPPNIIEVFPKYCYSYDFMAKCMFEHPRHLTTITPNMWIQFKKLALLDVKIAIYEMYVMLEGISTAFGNIDLKLDSFSNAKDERNTLIEEFEKRYLQQAHRKKILVL